MTVSEPPISGVDFLATVRKIPGIDYAWEITTPNGHPIRIGPEAHRGTLLIAARKILR